MTEIVLKTRLKRIYLKTIKLINNDTRYDESVPAKNNTQTPASPSK